MPPAAYGLPTSPQAAPPFGGGRPVISLDEFGQPAEDPHPGCWGAGGWASISNAGKGYKGAGTVKRIGGDPVEAADQVWVKMDFRRQLLRRHHTMSRAWTHLDKGMRGRISFYEINRACRDLGYDGNVRTLWEALDTDRDGFVSLHEIDPRVAGIIEGLAVCVWASCGSVEAAWKLHFNRTGKHRCTFEDFKEGCARIGYPGDAKEVYDLLNIDLGASGLVIKEFEFLKLWFTPPESVPVDARHPKAVMELTARLEEDDKHGIKQKTDPMAGKRKKEFKSLLLKSYGNYVRAWRVGLDRDHDGKLDYDEFKVACQDVGFSGARKATWDELDGNGTGYVSLSELDEHCAEMLQKFMHRAMKLHTGWDDAWATHFDPEGMDRVTMYDFIKGCRTLGYGGNAERLFDLLDVHRIGYLTKAGTRWMAGEDKAENVFFEDVGGLHLTGEFKKLTKSQQRRLQDLGRDRTVQFTKVSGRDRGEIEGAKPSESLAPTALRRSLSVASSMMPKDASPVAGVQALGRIPMGARSYPHDGNRSMASPTPGPPSRKHILSRSLSNFANMGGSMVEGAEKAHKMPLMPPHSPPGHGGFMTSKLGMARIANKDWREDFNAKLAKAA